MIRLIIMLSVASLGLAQQVQDPMDLVRHAYQLQESGDYAGATSAYREFLKLRPNEVGAHSNLGVVLIHLGHYDEAIAEYEAADKLAPGDTRIGLNLALAYEKSGRLTEARDRFEKLHTSSPENVQVTMLLADCNLRLGNNDRVVALLSPIEQQTPNDLATAYVLGTALIREKRLAEGQRLVDIILKNGDSAESRFMLGSQMFASGDYPSAAKEFQSAIALNAKVPELQAYFGQALLLTGDPTGASAAFRRELATDPNNFAANLGLAQILSERRQFDEAGPYAKKAVTLRPESAEALTALGKYQSGAGSYSDARKTLEEALRIAPEFTLAHQDLAFVYGRLGLSAKAKAEQERAKSPKTAVNDPGPKPGNLAPDFSLPSSSNASSVHLSAYRHLKPVVLVFGSYTCPNFRDASSSLDRLFTRYGQQAEFLMVYIREAHGNTNWQSTRNERDSVALADASNMAEKQQHATFCLRKLSLKFPALVDGMDGKVEHEYMAWPSRAFVIGEDGHILYGTRLTELDYRADEMENAIKRAIAKAN